MKVKVKCEVCNGTGEVEKTEGTEKATWVKGKTYETNPLVDRAFK